MAKQKFYCTGIESASRRRVAITLTADNRESAIRIAKQHGVAVQSVTLVREPTPAAPSAKPTPPPDETDEDVTGLLESPDDAEPPAAEPASPAAPATKTCPYCGESILAVAIRCKHCGSYLSDEPSGGRTEDRARRRGTPARRWVAIGAGGAIVVIAAAILVWLAVFGRSQLPVDAIPVAMPVQPASAPAAQPAPRPPEAAKPSAEEKAFATRLAAFLDGCDATAGLLENGVKPDAYRKQCDSLQRLYAAVPPPPASAPWAADASANGRLLLGLTQQIGEMDAINDLLPLDANARREAHRQTATKMRGLVSLVRSLIPPACRTP
ncbi:MAG: hypothetical protein ABFC96_13190 [Thermoguttaceae bacterium]